MDIPQKIDAIIQRRKQRLPEIEAAVQRLEQAQTLIDQFDSFRTQLNGSENEFIMRLAEQLAVVSTADFRRECGRSLTELKRLRARFSRDEVNISFVGRARQGKSLVLQRISGLEGDVIPSSDGSHCTGTRSIISNDPGSEPMAEIDFYTEREYADIINAYLEAIFHGSVATVSSVADIRRLDMKQLRERVDFESNELYELMKKYVDHVGEFVGKFGTHISVPKDQIESYVAQYSNKDHQHKFYAYLGVKQANIHAPFPCSQCGRIVLMDTIGAGDTALGIEEDMVAAVQNSDAIVLVLCPDAKADIIYKEEFDLVHLIARAVTPEYARQMLFWLMNRRETVDYNNARRIPVVIEKIKNLNAPVAQYLDVDCWQAEDVENNLLIPVLEQMSQNLDKIDQMIFDRVNHLLPDTEKAYQVISRSIERAESASVGEDVRREFRKRKIANVGGIIGRLSYSLQRLFLKYEEQKDRNCEPLVQAAEMRLKNILRALPSKEEILKICHTGENPPAIIMHLADMLRIEIVNDFLGLNEPLNELVLKMKREVVHCLADAEYGNLAPVVNADPEKPEEWLKTLRDCLDSEKFPMICRALQPLEDFELRMENFLIYKVRCCLNPIDWFEQAQTPPLLGGIQNEAVLVEDVQFHLRHNLEIIYNNIKKELGEYYSFPYTAMYAVVRDFFDRASCACDADGNTVKVEWQDLYEDSIQQLWPEEYRAYYAQKEYSDQWNDLCGQVQSCAVDGYFRINRKDTF